MTSVLDIANRALSAVGARSGAAGSVSALQSLNAASNEAFQVNLLFNPTRDDLLRGAPWNFCQKSALLSLLKSAPGTPENTTTPTQWSNAYPPPPWLYEYAYPSDCLRLNQIKSTLGYSGGAGGYGYPVLAGAPSGVGAMRKFKIASDTDSNGNPITVVLANLEDALAIYTAQITDPSLWDANFQQAMVTSLAARLALPLSGSAALKQELLQEAQLYVQNARVSDGNEGTTNTDHVPDWIAARGYAGDWITPGGYTSGWDAIAWLGI